MDILGLEDEGRLFDVDLVIKQNIEIVLKGIFTEDQLTALNLNGVLENLYKEEEVIKNG